MSAERPSSGDFGAKLRAAARAARRFVAGRSPPPRRFRSPRSEALERNDISRLPGGIFSRAFVRSSYAGEVGPRSGSDDSGFHRRSSRRTRCTAGHPTVRSGVRQRNLRERSTDRRRDVPRAASSSACRWRAPWCTSARRKRGVVAGRRDRQWTPTARAASCHPSSRIRAAPRLRRQHSGCGSGDRCAGGCDAPARRRKLHRRSLSVKRPCWVSAMVDGHIAIERLLEPGDLRKIEVRREMVLTAGDASAVIADAERRRSQVAREDRRGRHRRGST